MDPVEKTKEAQYSWALDEKERLVHIGVLNRQMRESGELGRFFCPGCNREMRVALGLKNTHFFSHDAKGGCGKETYLHQLGKIMLKEKFDSNKPFEIGIQCPVVCCESKQGCPFFQKETCSGVEQRTYDLKRFYDCCDIEKKIPSFKDPTGFYVADLYLSDSKMKNPPLFIEIAVTHFVGEKKAEDGFLIIEIPIKEEADIQRYVEGPIIERSNDYGEQYPMPVFYGPFKRRFGSSSKSYNRKSFTRVIVEPYGIFCTNVDENVNCLERMDRLSTTSLLEMNFDMNGSVGPWSEINPIWRAYAYAVDHRIPFHTDRYPTRFMLDRARKQLREMPWEVVYQR